MPAPTPPQSLQDILRHRQRLTFVGRESQLAYFRDNLERPIEFRHFVFNVWGQGGVGKTTLLRQFCQIAAAKHWVTAETNEAETTIPEVMGHLAVQLTQQGYPMAHFADRYRTYRQKQEELEADPDAPQGISALVGRTVAKAGLGLAKQIPGSGAVTPFLDEDALTSQAGEWAAFVAKKLTNKDEIRLVQAPVEVLTPLFLQDLNAIAAHTGIALFFDTYERTCPFLDGWLRRLLDGHYGIVPTAIVLTIAGRQELNRNDWGDYESVMVRLPLDPFTEAEARQYLAQKNVTSPEVIDVIWQLSGGLPVLLELLAFGSPSDPTEVGETSGTAVERLLKWVDDPKRRQIALHAALPRLLNQDILTQLCSEADANDLWQWLITMPFMEEHLDGWRYHDIVRAQMLRHKRLTSPQSCTDLHHQLATYYDTLRTALTLDIPQRYRDRDWQRHTLNFLYHTISQRPQAHLSLALNEFLAALKYQPEWAKAIAAIVVQTGQDVHVPDIEQMGKHLEKGLNAYEQQDDPQRYNQAVELFTTLLAHPNIDEQWQPIAFAWRGEAYRKLKDYESALADLNHAIASDPQFAWAIASRAETYRKLKRYDEALQDFDTAIAINPNYDWAMAQQAHTYRMLNQYEKAISRYNQAIALNPRPVWAIAGRAQTYVFMRDYDNALANFSQAIDLDPEFAWAIEHRGKLYRSLGQYEAALQDFDRAIELAPRNDWVFSNRAETYRMLGQYDQAIADFTRSIDLYANSSWKFAGRGETYRLMRQYTEALHDFDQAIELKPQDDWVLFYRGKTYLALQRYQDALADFNQAIKLNPKSERYFYNRALVYKALNQSEQAIADLAHAIQQVQQQYTQNPQDTYTLLNLALYHLTAGQLEPAQSSYRQALSQDVQRSHLSKAIRDLAEILEIFPNWRSVQQMKTALEKKASL